MRFRLLTASALLSLNLALSGCATSPLSLSVPSDNQVHSLLLQGSQFGINTTTPGLGDEEILAINDAMREFVAENVPSVLSPQSRLRYLTDSLISPKYFGVKYSPGVTQTAEGTFESREGNCLALTSLFIALAREAKLNAWFNEIAVPPSWDMLSDNSIAVYKHINAVVELGDGQEIVVDLSVDNYEYQFRETRVSDERAAAQFFNNRGVDMLSRNKLSEAYSYFLRALEADPKAGHIWGNLGSLFRRKGMNSEAEIAFLHALELDDKDQTALANLGRLYSDTQRDEEAKTINKLVRSQQLSNPFWHYGQAKISYEKGKFYEALDSIEKAIKLDRNEYRFYKFAAVIYRRLGDYDKFTEYDIEASKRNQSR